jgi:hypothetical protein
MHGTLPFLCHCGFSVVEMPKEPQAVKKDVEEMSTKEEELARVNEALDKMLKEKGRSVSCFSSNA